MGTICAARSFKQAGDRLSDGGYAQFLANWQHVEGEEWQDRCAPGCRAVVTPGSCSARCRTSRSTRSRWLRDAGDHRDDPAEYQARYDAWLDEFEARKVKAVGFGWITLRRTAAA